MERVRRYLNVDDENNVETTLNDVAIGASTEPLTTTPSIDDKNVIDDEDATSFLSSTIKHDGRSSDTKSIGSLSQHLFEMMSDDPEADEDEKYYGTCNGYDSHPGSKSNLLLCSECDQRSKNCNYRPQTPSHYGRFVEERIDRQSEVSIGGRHHQERRGSAVSSSILLKSPMKIDASTLPNRDCSGERPERRSKSIPSSASSKSQDQERLRADQDSRHHEVKISSHDRSPVRGNSPRYHEIDQRTWRHEQETLEVDEARGKRPQERLHESRSPVQMCERSPRRQEIESRVWTRRQEIDKETKIFVDEVYNEESEDSPPCQLCNLSNGVALCAHCNFSSDQDDPDLICFRCQMSAEEETTSVEGSICPKCENNYSSRYGTNGSSCQTTSSSSEGAKYPVDAVVKIQVNNRSIDVDSDDTIDSDPSNNRDSGGETCAGSIDRLETIVEAKNDTASENGDDNGSKINGQPRTKYLNYMIVLLL